MKAPPSLFKQFNKDYKAILNRLNKGLLIFFCNQFEIIMQFSLYLLFALYGRISWEKNKPNSNFNQDLSALERHKKDMFKWIEDNKHTVYQYYEDKISGGKRNKRKSYLKLLQDAKDKKFEAILCHSLDRFSRNQKDWYNDAAFLKELDIKFFTVSRGRIMYDAVLTDVEMMMSATYRKIVREKSLTWRSTRLKERRVFNRSPYGYNYNNIIKEYTIKTEEAQKVKNVFKMKIDGCSLSAIKFETGLNKPHILKILKNPFYIGYKLFYEKENIEEQPKYHLWKSKHISIILKEDFFKVNPKFKQKILDLKLLEND